MNRQFGFLVEGRYADRVPIQLQGRLGGGDETCACPARRQVRDRELLPEERAPDNRRFLADCERWFPRTVTVLRDEKFGADIVQVFRRKRFTKG